MGFSMGYGGGGPSGGGSEGMRRERNEDDSRNILCVWCGYLINQLCLGGEKAEKGG